MIRIVYVSQAKDIDFNKIQAILTVSHKHNKNNKISGTLIHGKGYFIQCLEGDKHEVESLYKNIILDNRHEHIELISKEDIQERYFNDWHISLMNDDAYKLLDNQYTKDGVFNPYAMRSEQLIMLLDKISSMT